MLYRLFGIPLLRGDKQIMHDGVKQYKYVSPPLSILEKLFLESFWNAWVNIYPMWLAPNLITALGGLCMFISTILIYTFSPSSIGSAPNWVYLLVAFLMFLYQTLDGTDGKQARRTKAGSAMGHLFDHGTDAVVGSMFAIWMADITKFGWGHPLPFIFIPMAQGAFFLSNMVPLHAGRQVFFLIDVMESEWATIIGLFLTGVFSPSMWSYGVPVPDSVTHFSHEWFGLPFLDVRTIILTACILQAFTSNLKYVYYAFVKPYFLTTERERVSAGVVIGRPGSGLLNCMHQMATIVTYVSLNTLSWIELWEVGYNPMVGLTVPMDIFGALPLFVLSVFGFGGLALSLLSCYVSRVPFPLLHYTIICHGFYFTNLDPLQGWVSAGVCLICYCLFVYQLINTITDALGIRLFLIKKKTV
eukprot:TRINITY_DN66502_c6_g1_i1.p1 TRINITY_DN66502_c6_g1~~TRINITY_DN66502_c6_g1_i1.p1  ORF type:complete len:415 (+),score=25.10 TRINITY_DN66502_c6_g1_i1:32-1276(+)